MKSTRRIVTFVLGIVAAAVFVVGLTACQGGLEKGLAGPVPATSQELIAELGQEKERIDTRTDAMLERIQVYNTSRAPGERKVEFSEIFYADLNDEQRDLLSDFLEEEKRPSYKNLLTQIIEDRETIQKAQDRIQHLEQMLPDKFAIVKKSDTHYDLASAYLQGEGVADDEAKKLLRQIDLNETLIPGFKVWYNYIPEEDIFRTYVTRGEAGQTPLAVKRAVKRNLVDERDAALARATALEHTKAELEHDVARLYEDVGELETRRSELTVQVADLDARNADLQVRGDTLSRDLAFAQNTLHYHADSKEKLAQQGILTRFLKNLKDVKGLSYGESLDLREAKSISFTPEPYGLTAIKSVEIWPEIYEEGRDYTVQVAEDGQSATVVINDVNMFRRQRVLISLGGKS